MHSSRLMSSNICIPSIVLSCSVHPLDREILLLSITLEDRHLHINQSINQSHMCVENGGSTVRLGISTTLISTVQYKTLGEVEIVTLLQQLPNPQFARPPIIRLSNSQAF